MEPSVAIHFNEDKHLKTMKHKSLDETNYKIGDNNTTVEDVKPTMDQQDSRDQSVAPTYLILIRFQNPPQRNLCFSNVTASCLLNILPIKQYLQENMFAPGSISAELSKLSKNKSDRTKSTQRLRIVVMSKCLESGQTTRTFNNNLQFDCVEFLQSLLEHLWNELPSNDRLQETVFGGLIVENLKCECGNSEKLPIQRLTDILSIPIRGETIQTCLDGYFSTEVIDRKCTSCSSTICSKSINIVIPPSTLILHLLRFTYDESTNQTRKLHNSVKCPLNLLLNSTTKYQLNSVINHIGESSTSGHYNILMLDKHNQNFILLDDLHISYNHTSDDLDEISYVAVYTQL